jgi:hypothetical protein
MSLIMKKKMNVKIAIVLKSFEPTKDPFGSTKSGPLNSLAKERVHKQALPSGQPACCLRQPSATCNCKQSSGSQKYPLEPRQVIEKSSLLSIRLPLRQSVYTVLRSPHIDKKSREQFEMKIHKQLIIISTNIKQLRDKLFHLKFHEMSGVQMKVIFHYKTRLCCLRQPKRNH